MNNIIEQLIEIRKSQKITQQRLSELTGIAQPTIARIEAGKQSPSIDMLNRLLSALDLELTIRDALDIPIEFMDKLRKLDYRCDYSGRSGDKLYIFEEKYILKISTNIKALELEKKKNDWLVANIGGPSSVDFIIKDNKAYYLRTFVRGTNLIADRFLDNPILLILVLKEVVEILRSLDTLPCPFKADSRGNDFIHGDLCLPNIFVDENNHFLGFIDTASLGKGDRNDDYDSLIWSFEYNLGTKKYTRMLKDAIGIE